MDTVSRVIAMLLTTVRKNGQEVDRLAGGIDADNLPDSMESVVEIRRRLDHNDILMKVAHALHEAEDRNIRKILESR